jgi:hypothetical protein
LRKKYFRVLVVPRTQENVISKKFQSTKYGIMSYIGMTKREENCPQGRRPPCLRLTLEPLGYGTCNIFNADPAGLCRPFDRPLNHRLQRDAGVTTLEAHQHVVDHRPCQSTSLLLQAATDSLFQLGYLPPDRVKMPRDPPNWAKAEGHQSSICLA